MKKVVTLCCTFFIALTLSAQWNPVYSDATKTYLDASFPTAMDGFVVGNNTFGAYFILKTTDGGVNWTEIALPPGFYNQIAMSSATSGYVCSGGSPGTILYTNDAFATTTAHPLDASFSTTGLELITDSSGFYMNNGSRLRSFNHYGDTIAVLMDTLTGADCFDVADDSTIYVGNGFHLLKSINAGATWFCVNSTLSMYIGIALCFVNADTGYYLGSTQGIWQTTNGGLTFQSVDGYYGNFMDAHAQYCASVFGLGTIRWSANYGQSWILEPLGMSNSSGVFLTPNGDCYVTNSNTGEIRKRQAPLSAGTIASQQGSISLYPNPTADFVIIENVEIGSVITITNSLGQVVQTEVSADTSARIDMANFAPGIYTCTVESEDRRVEGLIEVVH